MFRPCAKKPRARWRRHGQRVSRDIEGRSLVLLADLALHAESNVVRAHDLADEALAILPADERSVSTTRMR